MGQNAERIHNRTPDFVQEWCDATRTMFVSGGRGDAQRTTGPEDVISWLYGLFYSPEYRLRYRRPRFPIDSRLPPKNSDLLRTGLRKLGSELMSLHLLESPKVARPITEFIGRPSPVVEKLSWSGDTAWIDKAKTSGFRGVREDVWNFHIGGYQVCEKWLKDRKGRVLSAEDIAHYQKIVVAVSETIRIMQEIDEVIDQHGGWPGAFATGGAASADVASSSDDPLVDKPTVAPAESAAAIDGQIPLFDAEDRPLFQGPSSEGGHSDCPHPASENQLPLLHEPTAFGECLLRSRHSPNADCDLDDSPHVPVDQLDRNDVWAAIRDVFAAGGPRDRDQAIREVARALGYARVGAKIDEALSNDLRTAVRRGILENQNGEYTLLCRSIEQYQLDHLVEMLVAAMGGNWQSRDEATTAATRHMGYRRTGSKITEAFKSAINAGLRRGLLERDGPDLIRKAR